MKLTSYIEIYLEKMREKVCVFSEWHNDFVRMNGSYVHALVIHLVKGAKPFTLRSLLLFLCFRLANIG